MNKKLPPLPDPMHDSRPQTREEPAAKATKNDRRASAGRFAVLNEFVDCSLAGLSKTELIVWFTRVAQTTWLSG